MGDVEENDRVFSAGVLTKDIQYTVGVEVRWLREGKFYTSGLQKAG